MVLSKEELLNIIHTLSSHHELIAPVEEENGLYFRSVESPEQIIWEFANTVNNIKDYFFPPRQELYELKNYGIMSY